MTERFPFPKLAPQPGDRVDVWIDGIEQPIPATYRELGETRWFDIDVRFWIPQSEKELPTC